MEKREPKCFSTIKVTNDLHKMVRALEEAAVAAALADLSTTMDHLVRKEDTYIFLSYARKFLYEYLEELERMAEVDPPDGWTHLRFT